MSRLLRLWPDVCLFVCFLFVVKLAALRMRVFRWLRVLLLVTLARMESNGGNLFVIPTHLLIGFNLLKYEHLWRKKKKNRGNCSFWEKWSNDGQMCACSTLFWMIFNLKQLQNSDGVAAVTWPDGRNRVALLWVWTCLKISDLEKVCWPQQRQQHQQSCERTSRALAAPNVHLTTEVVSPTWKDCEG